MSNLEDELFSPADLEIYMTKDEQPDEEEEDICLS